MTRQFSATFYLIAAIIFLHGCKAKEKHPIVLGNIVLNKEVDFKSREFFQHLSEFFYIEDHRVKGNISEAVLADPELQSKDAVFHDRKISSNCFKYFSRAYFFNSFNPIDNYQYYDSTFMPVKEKKLLGGIFHPYQIENILTGVELELCTYTNTYSNCPCPDIITSTHFSAEVKNSFEQQMIEKHGKPDVIDINSRTLKKQLDKIGSPIYLADTSYWDIRQKGDEPMNVIMYEWKKDGYVVRMVIKRDGPIFSDNILDPAFKKYQSPKQDGRVPGSYLMSLFKEKPSSGTFRIDLMNNSLISYDSFYGFIKYELDEDTQNEIRNKLAIEKQKNEQKQKENKAVY